MKIAVYTIALNEEKHVQQWFDSVKDADLLLIADTGSTDKTVEVAQKLGITVHKIKVDPFRFDVARNASLALIPADIDICIQLDMDETLSQGWRAEVEKAFHAGNVWPVYKQVTQWDANGNILSAFDYFKIHPRHGFLWKYPIHEVIVPTDHGISYQRGMINVQAWHRQDRTKSRSSYLSLLELAVEEMPGDWRMQHYLCREYMYLGRWNDVIKVATKALKIKGGWDIERASTCMWAAEGAKWMGFDDWAFEWAVRATEEAPTFYEAWHWRAHIGHFMGKWDDVYPAAKKIETLERQTHHLVKPDVWTWWGFDLIALSAHNLGDNKTAVHYGEKAVAGSPNDQRLVNNLITYQNALKAQEKNVEITKTSDVTTVSADIKDPDIYVIHLPRHESRAQYFNDFNKHIEHVNWFDAIDAQHLDRQKLEADGVISRDGNWPENWPDGSLAGALTHRALWEKCVQLGKPIVILEDDAILSLDFHTKVKQLLAELPTDWDIFHLTWNFGNYLHLNMIDQAEGVAALWIRQVDLWVHLKEFQAMKTKSHAYRLSHSFGMPAYVISPAGAAKLLKEPGLYNYGVVDRLDVEQKYHARALSMNLNRIYPRIQAYVAFPAIAFVENRPDQSTIWNPDDHDLSTDR